MPKKLRVGFITDGRVTSKYVADLVEWAGNSNHIECIYVIEQKIPTKQNSALNKILQILKEREFKKVVENSLFKAIGLIEKILLSRYHIYLEHFVTANLAAFTSNIISVVPNISPSGFVHRFSEVDINKVRQLKLDVLIRCGSGILRGEILSAANYGVLSFHHGDNRWNRGGPPGFWEVLLKKDSTGFIIQQLGNELDGGNVLLRGSFPTQYFYLLNQASLYKKSNAYFKELLTTISVSGLPEFENHFPFAHQLLKRPNWSSQLSYLKQLTLTVFKKSIWRRVFKKPEDWQVGYQNSAWQDTVMSRARKIPNPPGRFLADPFVVDFKGETVCFVEEFVYATNRAHISAYRMTEAGAVPLGAVLNEPFHLSFPFIFKYSGKLYMCPEASESGQVRVYECEVFPLKWKLVDILSENSPTADTMLFEKDGKWWMFTNPDIAGTGDHCSELRIYWSDSPLSKNWTPHAKNPIFIDSLKARNAGVLNDGSDIFRVSQRQGFDFYGKGFSINLIKTLTTTEYVEEVVSEVEPTFFPDLNGTHHMHANHDYTVFDFRT